LDKRCILCKGQTNDAFCIGRTNDAFYVQVGQMTHFMYRSDKWLILCIGGTNDAFCLGRTNDTFCIGRTNDAFIYRSDKWRILFIGWTNDAFCLGRTNCGSDCRTNWGSDFWRSQKTRATVMTDNAAIIGLASNQLIYKKDVSFRLKKKFHFYKKLFILTQNRIKYRLKFIGQERIQPSTSADL
jgi:hypothetical protein